MLPGSNRSTDYIKPSDCSPPSMTKKSPLAMLVETCSNIGQELTKTTRPMENAANTSLERRKLSGTSPLQRKSASPTRVSGSPKHGAYRGPHRPVHASPHTQANPLLSHGPLNPSVGGGGVTAAAAAASLAQYQLMCQQIMYQAELEFIKTQELLATQKALSAGKAQLCSMCCLLPGYTGGRCAHTDFPSAGASVNPLLAMLASVNPLAYNSRASLRAPTSDATDRRSPKQSPRSDTSSSSISPSSKALPLVPATLPPFCQSKPAVTAPTAPAQDKECHWVDAKQGYCGKQFNSQDELMEHLRHHVSMTTTAAADLHTLSKRSAIGHNRFQPYSLSERGVIAPPLRH